MDLLTVDCSLHRLKLFQKGMDENDLDDNKVSWFYIVSRKKDIYWLTFNHKGFKDWSNYVIRFPGKRSSEPPV